MINLLWAAVLFVAVANAAAVAAKSRATPVGDGRDLQQLQGSSLTTTVKLTGFAQPVSFHWSPDLKHLYVAEKRGVVYVTSRWTASATDADVKVALDLTTKVWTFGDHGLSSIWVDQREGQHWLYATYMVLPARSTEAYCRDYGRLDGRNTADIAGCLSFARFSRWPLGDDGITNGPEQVIINGEKKNQHGSYLASAQFATDGITSCAQSDTDPTTMYISIGDGAADSTADIGQLGSNPCLDRPGYSGALRAQDSDRMNGKVIRIDLNAVVADPAPDSGDGELPTPWTVFTSGHRNPWRLSVHDGDVWLAEPGWFRAEEINKLIAGRNYGWPCFEGDAATAVYSDAEEAGAPPFHGMEACINLQASNGWERPYHEYGHTTTMTANGEIPVATSVTAVLPTGSLVFFADYSTRKVSVVLPNGSSRLLLSEHAVVEMRRLPDGTIALVSFEQGAVIDIDSSGLIKVSPSPAAMPAGLRVTASVPVWTADGRSPVTLQTNAGTDISRDSASFVFNVTHFACPLGSTACQQTALQASADGSQATITSPSTDGYLRVTCEVRTKEGGTIAVRPLVLASTLAEERQCDCKALVAVGATSTTVAQGLPGGVVAGIVVATVFITVGLALVWVVARRYPTGSEAGRMSPAQRVAHAVRRTLADVSIYGQPPHRPLISPAAATYPAAV